MFAFFIPYGTKVLFSLYFILCLVSCLSCFSSFCPGYRDVSVSKMLHSYLLFRCQANRFKTTLNIISTIRNLQTLKRLFCIRVHCGICIYISVGYHSTIDILTGNSRSWHFNLLTVWFRFTSNIKIASDFNILDLYTTCSLKRKHQIFILNKYKTEWWKPKHQCVYFKWFFKKSHINMKADTIFWGHPIFNLPTTANISNRMQCFMW